MSENWKFDLQTISKLQARCSAVGLDLSIDEHVSPLTQPLVVGGCELPNSLAIHPMEGCDGNRDGTPGELTRRRYNRFAAGGSGLIWVEAIAVCEEGRANPRQLWINSKNKESFAELIADIRRDAQASMGPEHRPYLVAQLTHSGRYSRPIDKPAPMIAQRDPYRDPLAPEPYPTTDRPSKLTDAAIVSDDYLEGLKEKFVAAAELAIEVGFDAVDIKACHGYLICELLSARGRTGRYGGSFENRTRFMIEVIESVQERLKSRAAVTTRMGCYDAVPYPFGWGIDREDYRRADLSEPLRLVRMLEERGVEMINLTMANPYYNPHVGRPFTAPVKGGYPDPEDPLLGVKRLIDGVGAVQRAHPRIAIVGTGYSWLRHQVAPLGAAVKRAGLASIIGVGRMGFAYPDFAKDIIEDGAMQPGNCCIACSACTQMMRDGQPAGCPVRDREVYKPLYDEGRKGRDGT